MLNKLNLILRNRWGVMLFPILVIIVVVILWMFPFTRRATLWMVREDHPVEMLTFLFFLFGGILGLILASRIKKTGEKYIVYTFYYLFSIALLIIAMEEIAWGQWFLGFETPEAWFSINGQGETTLHNLNGLQGHSDMLCFVFGVGGLIGVYVSYFPTLHKIGVPNVLISWFVIIAVHGLFDALNDYMTIQEEFDRFISRTDEIIELLIAMSSILYIYLKFLSFEIIKIKSTK